MSLELEEAQGYIIFGDTGCTCCSQYNFIEGPYKSEEEVRAAVEQHKQNGTVASQYSKTGHYSIQKIKYEVMTLDGEFDRMFIGNTVYYEEFFNKRQDNVDTYFEGEFI